MVMKFATKVNRDVLDTKPLKKVKTFIHISVMTSQSKEIETFHNSWEPEVWYIIRKPLTNVFQKCNFYWIWVTEWWIMGILVEFWQVFGEVHVTKIRSRDLSSIVGQFFFNTTSQWYWLKVIKLHWNMWRRSRVMTKNSRWHFCPSPS